MVGFIRVSGLGFRLARSRLELSLQPLTRSPRPRTLIQTLRRSTFVFVYLGLYSRNLTKVLHLWAGLAFSIGMLGHYVTRLTSLRRCPETKSQLRFQRYTFKPQNLNPKP